MTDGPLIVQSDKTLLLEVDHELAARVPAGHRAVRRARARPRARPHLPADPARPVERPGRRARRRAGRRHAAAVQPLRRPARAARRRRRDDGPVRPAAAAASTRRTAWCWSRPTARCSRRCCARKKVEPLRRRPGRRRHRRRAPQSERGHLKQVLLKLGWPAEDLAGYVDGEAHADRRWSRTAGRCAPTSARPPTASGTAAPASSCCPAAPARRSSGPPRWPGPRPPR